MRYYTRLHDAWRCAKHELPLASKLKGAEAMRLNEMIEQALAQVAWRHGADLDALRSALSHESAEELAQALGIDRSAAEERMAPVRRCLSVQTDWGAGCMVLTDAVQQDLLEAIAAW
jgi:hypothetical protein